MNFIMNYGDLTPVGWWLQAFKWLALGFNRQKNWIQLLLNEALTFGGEPFNVDLTIDNHHVEVFTHQKDEDTDEKW